MKCKECGQELGKVRFTGGDSFICLNWQCQLDHCPQAYGNRLDVEPPATNEPRGDHHRPSYYTYQERRKENYRELRKHGVPSREAAYMTSDKQTDFYLASCRGTREASGKTVSP